MIFEDGIHITAHAYELVWQIFGEWNPAVKPFGVTTPSDAHTFSFGVSLRHLFNSKDFLIGGLQFVFIK